MFIKFCERYKYLLSNKTKLFMKGENNMKAKKLFPDLSFKRLWDKIKDLEDKVGEGSDSEQNKNLDNCIKPIDTTKIIKSETSSKSATYTATENCWAVVAMGSNAGEGSSVKINDVLVLSRYCANAIVSGTNMFHLSQGDELTINASYSASYTIYGCKG